MHRCISNYTIYITTQQLEPGGQPTPRILHKSVQLTGGVLSYSLCAPLTFNMEPDNKTPGKGDTFGKASFSGSMFIFGGCMSTWEISKHVHIDLAKHGKSPKRTNGSLLNFFNSNLNFQSDVSG